MIKDESNFFFFLNNYKDFVYIYCTIVVLVGILIILRVNKIISI